MVRPEKIKEVERLTLMLQDASSVVLVDFRGLNVQKAQELREECRENEVQYRVVKNTLLGRALDEVGIALDDGMLEGPTALALSYDDPVAPAQRIKSFAKEHGVLEIKGGISDGEMLNSEEVRQLADLPSREELLAKIAHCFAAPMTRVAQVLQAPMRDLSLVTSQVKEKKAG